MNKFDKYLYALFSAVLLSLPFSSAAKNQDTAHHNQWTFEIESEEMKNYLYFPTSKLKPVVKTKVSYYLNNPEATSDPIHYEDLFYGKDKVIGCHRLHPFDLQAGESFFIKIKDLKTGSHYEANAAADAILRIMMDGYVKYDPLISITVPDRYFNDIIQGLQHYNFYLAPPTAPDQAIYSAIVLRIYSDPPGKEEALHYAGPTE